MKKFILSAVLLSITSIATADSFWEHNGSIMRLVDNSTERAFIYETPSQRMLNTGVRKGVILFRGYKHDDKYFGSATVFSKNCYYDLSYSVRGTVYSGPKIILTGRHTEYYTEDDECKPTGRVVTDKLVFNYLYSE